MSHRKTFCCIQNCRTSVSHSLYLSHLRFRMPGCSLPTCQTANLGDSLQTGDEKAGKATIDRSCKPTKARRSTMWPEAWKSCWGRSEGTHGLVCMASGRRGMGMTCGNVPSEDKLKGFPSAWAENELKACWSLRRGSGENQVMIISGFPWTTQEQSHTEFDELNTLLINN